MEEKCMLDFDIKPLLRMRKLESNPNMPKEAMEKLFKNEGINIDFTKPIPKEILEKLMPKGFFVEDSDKPVPKEILQFLK